MANVDTALLLRGDHASRPAANTVIKGALYYCTTHAKIYQGAGAANTWSDYTGTIGSGDALTSGHLGQFAATTSAQLAGVISDETGSGALVFASAPTLTNPIVGTQSPGDNSTKAASTAYADAAAAAAAGTYTDEKAQDAVGAALTDSATIDFTYNDGANTITAIVIDGSITGTKITTDVALGGNPTTTTQTAGNNSTRIATTAYVDAAVGGTGLDTQQAAYAAQFFGG